jgi:hypothetical protein
MNIRCSIFLFVAVLTVMASCKNNDEVFRKVVTTGLNIVNASADTLNFYLNGTRLNSTSSLFPLGQTYYLPVASGSQNFSFKKAGSPNTLFNLPLTLQDSVNNSVYVTGETAAGTFHTVDFLDITGIDSGKIACKIRFVNASPDAGNLNVTIGDTVSFSSVFFKTTEAFQLTGPTSKKEVKVYLPGVTKAKVDTLITVQAGYMYTVYSKGLINGTGNAAFNIGIALNYAPNL